MAGGGGQRGLSFLGEDKLFTALATFAVTVLLQLQFGCFSAGDDAMSEYDQECEQVYADANDGNPDTEVETAILEQPDCMAHIAAVKAERLADQSEQIQEAQTP